MQIKFKPVALSRNLKVPLPPVENLPVHNNH